MKVMRIATLGVALLLAATTVADAQDTGGRRGGGRGGRGGQAALLANITLAADVQAKVDSVFARYQTQSMEIRQAAGGGGGGGGGRGAPLDSATQMKITELNNKRNAEVRALLSAEQQKTFDENVATAAASRGRRGGGGGAPPPPPPVR